MGPRLSLDALQVLDAIERRGTFAAAADELFRTASTLSYVIQKLESDLGVSVFDRSGHRARLTPVGRTLLDEGRHILHAVADLERRAQRIASGWEAELRIALDAIVPFARVLPALTAFYAEQHPTRLRFSREVLGGSWEAMMSGRADLVIGAVGSPPTSPDFTIRTLGDIEMRFVVAPTHPLATETAPLERDHLLRHRAIVIGDTSRQQAPRTLGVLDGQDTLVVPNVGAKLAALCAGLGFGHLPIDIVATHLESGQLIAKNLRQPRARDRLFIGWRNDCLGTAGQWWVDRIDSEGWLR